MSYPMQPYLIGAISDAIDFQFGRIAAQAAETQRGVSNPEFSFRRALGSAGFGSALGTDNSRIEQACVAAKSTFYEWWKYGRRIIRQGEIDARDVTRGTHYLRLNQFPSISVGSETLRLEGAFISGQQHHDGQRDWAMTFLFSGDLERDVGVMSLDELTRHQASMFISTWNADKPGPETAFYGRLRISDHPDVVAAVGEMWSDLTHAVGCGGSTSEKHATPILSLMRR
ncbi:hypothetical protein [Agrobacterium burrii]|uniref:Uncharacterized protein n=1 Tax=Agrobacterium burrii TaxID=2815339 RepID=A0ABS3EL16_9HYPH|nr:hypothetical protein [Agrobacterium burrii]MBO0132298.1 hypothetical protein [Agrobacterium burrii]